MQWRIGEYSKYESFIRDAERRYDIPLNLLAVTLFQASQYDPAHINGTGRNPLGVIGIANLMPSDCRILWGGNDRRTDPLASIAGAARLLAAQHSRFKDWRLALLAYHSNAQIVADHVREHANLSIRAKEYTEQASAHCRL